MKTIKAHIENELNALPEKGDFPKEATVSLRKIISKTSFWDVIKETGFGGIPSGQPSMCADRIRAYCAKFDLWTVPVGELEQFCKQVGASCSS